MSLADRSPLLPDAILQVSEPEQSLSVSCLSRLPWLLLTIAGGFRFLAQVSLRMPRTCSSLVVHFCQW